MQKDIIYVDVEDDITAIIGKVKNSKEKIVALVPPKRIGVLQSAVNLRLIERAATQAGKRLVVISSNAALASLAAAAKIPVAKNLQSKPELGEIAALDVDDGEDIIDGSSLPVGDHARVAGQEMAETDAAAASVIDDDGPKNIEKAPAPTAGELPSKPKTKSGPKVPNFDKFRKKLFLLIGGGVLLIAFLIWALFFSAQATVEITAKTTDTSLNQTVTLSSTGATSVPQNTLKSVSQSMQKNISITFAATGSKNIGDKATGNVSFSNSNPNGATLAAGSPLTASGGQTFTLDSAVTVPGATLQFSGCGSSHLCPGTASGTVTASAPGANYNGASGNLSGTPSGVAATFQGSTSGGSDKTVKVVSASDIAGAQQQAQSQNTDQIKSQLSGQFGSDAIALKDTFQAGSPNLTSSPAQDAEADSGQATLSGTITYTMVGVQKSELTNFLNQYFQSQLQGQSNQHIYDNGLKSANFTNISIGSNQSVSAQLTATGKIGPAIDNSQVKKLAEGKRLGEIQAALSNIQGVQSVDVKYSPFWVSTAPNDPNRITIQFKLNGK